MNCIQAYCVFVFMYDETQDVHFPTYPRMGTEKHSRACPDCMHCGKVPDDG